MNKLSPQQLFFQMENSGYTVIRNVFTPDDILALKQEFDRLKEFALQYHSTYRDKNIVFLIKNHPALGRHVRFIHWAPYLSNLLDNIRIDKRFFDILNPIIGCNIKQIQSQTSWKTAGTDETYFSFHQDYRYRKPASAFRNIGRTNLNTLMAIDRHTVENGCLQIYPGSHKLGELNLPQHDSILSMGYHREVLTEVGLDPAKLVDIELEPGDIAMWYSYVIHGSGPNLSKEDRRAFLNSYIKAEDSDRGEWAFKDGAPCLLEGEPALINYNGLYQNKEGHYFDGEIYPMDKD